MHETQCTLCRMGVGAEEGRSEREVAQEYGVHRRSVGRHRAYLAKLDAHQPGDSFLRENGIPVGTVTSRRMSTRLDDGTWQSVSWQPNKAEDVDPLTYEDLEDLLSNPLPAPSMFTPGRHAEVLMLSDLQIGKAAQRGGGTPETLERARQSLATFVAKVQQTKPMFIVLVDGGDPIENVFNVKSQLVTNDLTPDAQVRTFRRLFAEFIRAVAPYAPHVFVVSVPSNHGAVRSGYGNESRIGGVDSDWGLDINYSLEEQFTGRRGFEHVQFIRPDSGEATVVLDVAGTGIAFNHGDGSKGVAKHGEWWARQDHGRLPGWDADILVMSHYHTFNVGHSGNGRWIISASSSDPGSDWFTSVTGEAARQGMTTFAVEDGQWSGLAVI